jgi:hypothetical protein
MIDDPSLKVTAVTLSLKPLSMREANEHVARIHRHHDPVRGCKFAVGAVTADGTLAAVAIAGQPAAFANNDGWTLEITRLASDGTPNACSMLYGAARRAAAALGYRRLLTYTLATEPGISLRAAGWTAISTDSRPRTWDRPNRRRARHEHELVAKTRWEIRL